MADEPDNLVLALLREIRQQLVETNDKIDDLKVGQNAHTGMLMALAGYIRDIDVRVEHLEEKIGAAP